MGFQECENGLRVLEPVPGLGEDVHGWCQVGLLSLFEVVQGELLPKTVSFQMPIRIRSIIQKLLSVEREDALRGGPHATCLAYRKGVWKMLSNGSLDVGEDRHRALSLCRQRIT